MSLSSGTLPSSAGSGGGMWQLLVPAIDDSLRGHETPRDGIAAVI
jgi:hypothetical protein